MNSVSTCRRCGLLDPTPAHYGSRVCQARAFIATMEGYGYVRIPARRWTRRFKKAGVHVVHGPVSIYCVGNWAPKLFVNELIRFRRRQEFRKIPFHLQVEVVVWSLTHGSLAAPAPA